MKLCILSFFTVAVAVLVLQARGSLIRKRDTESTDEVRLIGDYASPAVLPYLAYIQTYNKSDDTKIFTTCTGAILSTTVVVTTASCITGWKLEAVADSATVYVGLKDYNGATVDTPDIKIVTGGKVMIHEKFHINTMDNDIALVTIKALTLVDKKIAVIPLPKSSATAKDAMAGKVNIAVHGFGSTDATTTIANISQTIVKMPVGKSADCAKQLVAAPYYFKLPDTSFCANGTGTNGLCNGDLGAVAVAEMKNGTADVTYLVGLGHKWVGTTCPSKVPNLFVRVAEFATWIQTNGGPTAPK